MQSLFYALACVAVPAVWGFVSSAIYDRLEMRLQKPVTSDIDDASGRGNMYHI